MDIELDELDDELAPPTLEYCTGQLYEQKVAGRNYWNLAHHKPCPVHTANDTNLERIPDDQLPGIRALIANYNENEITTQINLDDVDLEDDEDVEPKQYSGPSQKVLYIWAACLNVAAILSFVLSPFIIIVAVVSLVASILQFFAIVRWHIMPEDSKEKHIIARQKRRTEQENRRRRRKVKWRAYFGMRLAVRDSLTYMGFATIAERKGAMVRYRKPILSLPLVEDDAITYRIIRMPYNTKFADLLEEWVNDELSRRVGRECEVVDEGQNGVFVRVTLLSGSGGIKKRFLWRSEKDPLNAIDMISDAPPMAIPVGIGTGRRLHYELLGSSTMPHLLIAGATGGGKSVFINNIICTLISRNSPDELRLVLVDLKNGLELGLYAGIPHLMKEIVKDRENLIPVLEWLKGEMQRRFDLIEAAGVRDIKAYNAISSVSNKLARIVFIIDEISTFMRHKELKTDGLQLLIDMIEQARVAGISIIIATQIVKAEVLPTLIRGNIPAAICFRVGGDNASKLVLDTGHAARLPDIPGRMIFKIGSNRYELQAPLLEADEVYRVIDSVTIAGGEVEGYKSDTSIIRKLFQDFGYRMSAEAIRAAIADMGDYPISYYRIREVIKNNEFDFTRRGPVFNVDGLGACIITPTNGRRISRWLLPIGDSVPLSPEEADVRRSEFVEKLSQNLERDANLSNLAVEVA